MKKLISVIAIMALLCSCGTQTQQSANTNVSGTETQEIQPLDLKGTWIQSNSNSDTMYQKAIITDNAIEVYWVDTESDSEMLYWAGTFENPENGKKEFSWDSVNDKEKTGTALMASPDDTKTFNYSNEVISYSVSAMGTSQTVKLKLEK